MDISNPHNLLAPPQPASALRFGVRVTPMATDPFRQLVDPGWSKVHWYGSRRERDEAMAEMGKRHAFSRLCDRPTIVLEPIER